MGVSRDCSIFWVPPIISGTGEAMNVKFCMHIHRNKKSIKNVEKSSLGHSQGQGLTKIFRAAICRSHRAVIFVTAQLSCLYIAYMHVENVGTMLYVTYLSTPCSISKILSPVSVVSGDKK